MGNLTNVQAAYRLPQFHDGFIARLNERARNLFADGYTVEPTYYDGVFRVYNGKHGELPYTVDAVNRTCDCDFFRQQHQQPLREDGKIVACKHLRGLRGLVQSQIAAYMQEAEEAHHEREEQIESLCLSWAQALRASWQVAAKMYHDRQAA